MYLLRSLVGLSSEVVDLGFEGFNDPVFFRKFSGLFFRGLLAGILADLLTLLFESLLDLECELLFFLLEGALFANERELFGLGFLEGLSLFVPFLGELLKLEVEGFAGFGLGFR